MLKLSVRVEPLSTAWFQVNVKGAFGKTALVSGETNTGMPGEVVSITNVRVENGLAEVLFKACTPHSYVPSGKASAGV